MQNLFKFFVTITTFVLFAVACNSSNENSTQDSATSATQTISEEKKTSIAFADTLVDFGTKPKGELIKLTYRFTNTGNNPLILKAVRPSCGCTIADYPKEPIAPGAQGEINAEFDTNKSEAGSVQKVITVLVNDEAGTDHYLSFKGNVTEAKF